MYKPCNVCKTLVPAHEWLEHQQAHRNEGKSTVARGYGYKHRALRKQWAARIASSIVICRRGNECLLRDRPAGNMIVPGEPWELGHDESRQYSHPEHLQCNRATAGR
jgi:hypothetical protein